MSTGKIDIKGLDYTIEGVESDFIESYESISLAGGNQYEASRSEVLRNLTTYPDEGKIAFKHRNHGEYTLHNWSDGKGLLTDPSDLVWLYDNEDDVTAYFNGEEFVAAYNPDICDVWDEIMAGKWMADFIDEIEDRSFVMDGLNRLHPKTQKRVARGLNTSD